jgi:hypothetical protein
MDESSRAHLKLYMHHWFVFYLLTGAATLTVLLVST